MVRRATTGKAPDQPIHRMAGGGGGGGGALAANVQAPKDISGITDQLSQNVPKTIQISRNQNKQVIDVDAFAKRLDKLDEIFHEQRSQSRRGKRLSFNVVDDGRITPSERLKCFVKAATEQGYNPAQAIELALQRMESKANVTSQTTNASVNWDELLR